MLEYLAICSLTAGEYCTCCKVLSSVFDALLTSSHWLLTSSHWLRFLHSQPPRRASLLHWWMRSVGHLSCWEVLALASHESRDIAVTVTDASGNSPYSCHTPGTSFVTLCAPQPPRLNRHLAPCFTEIRWKKPFPCLLPKS